MHPDPLEFLYRYSDVRDREIAGLVASGLAYGRVNLILRSVERVLDTMGRHPSDFLSTRGTAGIRTALSGFRHRFTPGEEVADFLGNVSRVQADHGLLGNLLAELLEGHGYQEALDLFTGKLLGGMDRSYLLPRPSRGSACKRLHLFLRWMVREDSVDPGGWAMISPARLIVPVDVHMFRIGRCLGFTGRKSPDGRAAAEITEGFREYAPHDPVKYDFALTRYGIRSLTDCTLFEKLLSRS